MQTKLYKIPKFGVNRPNSKQDTAIWKCQNLKRNVWPSRCSVHIRTLSEHSIRKIDHTFLCWFWHFWIPVSQSKLAWLTPNLGILWIAVCSFWLWGSMVFWFFFLTFFINNIDITFTISTNNTCNTLEYNKRKKNTFTFPSMTCKESCVKSYKAQRKVIDSPRLQAPCQLKVSIYCNNVHLN